MKRKSTLGVVLALAAAAPAVFVPKLVPQAAAQPAGAQPADYPDVPQGHWAYAAINKLSQAGIIEGRPGGTYNGNEPMTRYEFAVAIARLLNQIPTNPGGPGVNLDSINARLAALEARQVPDITRAQVLELINALQTEFRDELGRLGVRVTAIEDRLSTLENRVTAPPRQTFTPAVLHRTGYTNYISAQGGRAIFNGANGIGIGGGGFAANIPNQGLLGGQAVDINLRPNAVQGNPADKKFAYTDLELRLTDRVTDRLAASAALRSLGSTQEDPWTGDSQGGVYVRELYGVADLSDRSILSIRGLSAVLGRQRTKIAQGLLYDNDFAPTDQIKGLFRIGPIGVQAFVGTNNNQNTGFLTGGGVSSNPYTQSGSVQYLGNGIAQNSFGQGGGSAVGFPGQDGVSTLQDDNESLVRVSGNLFQISGQPVTIGATRQFDGVGGQRGDSFDLTLPLFNRTVGFEYVRQNDYANGGDSDDASAYIATVPILRSNILDLNGSYGKAKNNFEYFISSSANPFARSYGEALFDRPLFLGAPMINGNGGDVNGGGAPLYMAAKKGYDFNGTLRAPLPILRRIPLDFRFYRARGTDNISLGSVFTVGTTFNVTPGVDLELKYGNYDVPGPTQSIRYLRAGANIGF